MTKEFNHLLSMTWGREWALVWFDRFTTNYKKTTRAGSMHIKTDCSQASGGRR